VSERILLRLPNWLGDALLARPLLHAVRAARPDAEIVAVAPSRLLELLAPERTFDRAEPWPEAAPARAALAAQLRRRRPHAALVLPPSFSSAAFAWATGARVRVGYAHDLRSPLLTHALRRRPRGERHLSREFLDLGGVLGAAPVPLPALAIAAEALDGAHQRLANHGLGEGDRYVLLAPRSVWGPAREWPRERFVAAGAALAASGLRVLVCGVAAERAPCAAIAAAIGAGAASLAGETDLPQLAALCRGAALVLGNDSGIAHLAAATCAPTVQIYGSASSAWTHALGPRVAVIHRAPVCSPCWQRTCRIGYACLGAVEVAHVLRTCSALARVRAA